MPGLSVMKPGDDIWFPATHLALLGGARVIDFPRHDKSAREKARKLGWKSREMQCKGGKKGYRSEFQPPEDILEVILTFLNKNPDFFKEDKKDNKDKSSSKPYPVSKVTALTLKSPEPAHTFAVIDSETMIYVMVSVDSLLAKKGENIDPIKKAELILLIYDYCKGTGKCDEEVINRFLKLAD
ncbi:MAG: hypothetical protein AABZ18_05465 [Pseudomonadota bacterium]